MDENDVLEEFLQWFLAKAPCIGMVPFHEAVGSVEGVTKILLYRRGEFQVQLFAVPPNYIIPEHIHPNVDSFEVYVGGQINFSHGGKFVNTKWEDSKPDEYGLSPFRGVQRWLNGVKPHCVASDYTGVVMGKDHADKVVYGTFLVKDSLGVKDAASFEG
jgi:hypothetical protein